MANSLEEVKTLMPSYCASFSESIGNSIVVVDIEYDMVKFYRIDGSNFSNYCWANIQYTKKGKAFFISRGKRYFFENFLKNC